METNQVILLIFVLPSVTSVHKELHKHMSIDELKNVFHVEHHSSVPEYRVIQLNHHVPETHELAGHSSPSAFHSIFGDEAIHDKFCKNELKYSKFINENHKSRRLGSMKDTLTVDEDLKDGDHRIRTTAFGKLIDLNLRKTEGLFKKGGLKMWNIISNKTQPHGVQFITYQEMRDEADHIGETYQDHNTLAALVIRKDPRSGIFVDGSIGHDLVIKPLPSTLIHESASKPLALKNLSLEQNMLRKNIIDALEGAKHIIYKRINDNDDRHSSYASMEPNHLHRRYRRNVGNDKKSRVKKISKRDLPHIVYPEILVILDYDGYRLHGKNELEIKRYLASFWNGVDLRYKFLKGPKIHINIAGFLILKEKNAAPYLERNKIEENSIDSEGVLSDVASYIYKETRLPIHDITVVMTKYDMCHRLPNGYYSQKPAGFAYVGGACMSNKRLEKTNSVAIVEDTGGFSGIIVAVHEVGHLLGAVHDGSPPTLRLGGPGALNCKWEDGYIMSDIRQSDKGFRWSPCSILSFQYFLNSDHAVCLYDSPHEDELWPRILPGKLLSLDDQCIRDRGTRACFKDERVCAQLFCADPISGLCVAVRPAAEGSPCGDGKYCRNGRCVSKYTNYLVSDTCPLNGNNTVQKFSIN